ncbi:MAG: EamA family transporter [Paludibacteraceae bacterium]|nr:EamA family transporter [Paludibacteraceae bacterium]
MLIWGSSPIATKLTLGYLNPLTLITMRMSLAVMLMLVAGLLAGSLQRIEKKHLPLFLIGGFIQPFLYYVLETYGLRLSASPTVSEVLLSTSPLMAPLFAYILVHERVTWNNIVGILLSTAGVVMMVFAGNASFSIGSPWGIVLLLAAVVMAVLYTVVLRKIPAKYNSFSTVFYIEAVSLLFFLPVWAVVDAPRLDQMKFEAEPLCAVAYLAVFASVVAFVLFCYAVRELGVTRANAFNNTRPVFTALIMLCFFGEHMPWMKWLAMAIVIIGLFICQYQKKNVSLSAKNPNPEKI